EPGRNVVISQRTGGIRCPEVRLILRNEVPIFKINPQATGSKTSLLSELEMIECHSLPGQPVHAELVSTRREQTTSNDPNHESTGFYYGEFGSFAFQYSSGEFLGEGPGWLRVSSQKEMNLPGNASPASDSDGSASDGESTVSPFSGVSGSIKSFMSRPWKHMHLTFQKSFAGNTNAKCITLNQQVDLIVASSFTSENKLDIAKSETHPSDAIFLNCQQLRFETVPGQQNETSQEFIATGNVNFRQGPFSGRAQTLNYSVAKDVVRMEGSKIAPASIYKKEYAGAPTVSLGNFMRGTFHVKTQKVDLENYTNTGAGL
ncbi:MAG: hypothetical protein Q4G59_13025, partial [Planctomycetia bacterium]|nr:hypothetical protein [Planctomycetia bacterium]